jgi:hypothetical protein
MSHQIDLLKWTIAKYYHSRGRLIDSHSVEMNGSTALVLKHGIEALREKFVIQSIISRHFNEMGLSRILHSYNFNPKYLYVGGRSQISLYNPDTKKKIRSIDINIAGNVIILGLHQDKLYVTIGIDYQDSAVYAVDLTPNPLTGLSTVTLVVEKISVAYMYKDVLSYFMCGSSEHLIMVNLRINEIKKIVTDPNANETYQHGRYLQEEDKTRYDLETGEQFNFDGFYLGSIGRLAETPLLSQVRVIRYLDQNLERTLR